MDDLQYLSALKIVERGGDEDNKVLIDLLSVILGLPYLPEGSTVNDLKKSYNKLVKGRHIPIFDIVDEHDYRLMMYWLNRLVGDPSFEESAELVMYTFAKDGRIDLIQEVMALGGVPSLDVFTESVGSDVQMRDKLWLLSVTHIEDDGDNFDAHERRDIPHTGFDDLGLLLWKLEPGRDEVLFSALIDKLMALEGYSDARKR